MIRSDLEVIFESSSMSLCLYVPAGQSVLMVSDGDLNKDGLPLSSSSQC